MSVLANCEPKEVFRFFEEIAAIPRASFHTKAISDYCVRFAKDRELEVVQDKVNNVIIKKAGTKGYEDLAPVILQGHLDMVCEKTLDSKHDFDKDGLDLFIEEGFVKAKDTTLGADNGIAIAYALAILDSDTIVHPPLEVLFTIDEETGMGGASAVDLSLLKGELFINMDSDEEGVITAGCAGGFRASMCLPIEREDKHGTFLEISLQGLRGGHSGIEIHEQRGNANKLLARLLNHMHLHTDIRLVSFEGGTKDNVITPAATMSILVQDLVKSREQIQQLQEVWKAEFAEAEPTLQLLINETNESRKVLSKESSDKVIYLLHATPNGVQSMMRSFKELVETSLNLGVVSLEEEALHLTFSARSALKSKLELMQETLETWALHVGAKMHVSGAYPAWTYKSTSRLREVAKKSYENLYHKEPIITTIHAGLECGILLDKRPELDCISFGPNMYDIHSVQERLDIESTKRTWLFLIELLANCKEMSV